MGWHGSCYKQRATDNYPRYQLPEEADGFVDDPREAMKFKCARDGDNFLAPFQCDICHFRNLYQRDPSSDKAPDMMCLVAIRRATLDAFWARAATTVNGTRLYVKKLFSTGKQVYGLGDILPEMGPFNLQDDFGMRVAIITLHQSLSGGRYRPTLQYGTARKYRSAFSDVWGASTHTFTESVMARDTVKTFVTKCPTSGMWYERYNNGMHSRMGDDRRPDIAISSEVMVKMMEILEEAYYLESSQAERRFIARATLFFLAAYLGSLRGEEVPRIVRKHFIELNEMSMEDLELAHAVLPLYGIFKNEGNIARCHLMRISLETKSGFDIGKWVKIVSRFEMHSNNKFLFSDGAGKREALQTYSEIFVRTLEEVRRRSPSLIPASIDIAEGYGISRSFRRGSTGKAQNALDSECSELDINRNNGWRKKTRAAMKTATQNMITLYTDTRQIIRACLRFSKCQ